MTAMGAVMGSIRPAALAALDTITITNGGSGTITAGDRIRGFTASPALGSISPTTSAIYAAAAIKAINYDEGLLATFLAINGTLANSGWTTMTVKTTVYNRVDAYFYTSGGVTYWNWASGSVGAFGAIGSNATVVFA